MSSARAPFWGRLWPAPLPAHSLMRHSSGALSRLRRVRRAGALSYWRQLRFVPSVVAPQRVPRWLLHQPGVQGACKHAPLWVSPHWRIAPPQPPSPWGGQSHRRFTAANVFHKEKRTKKERGASLRSARPFFF